MKITSRIVLLVLVAACSKAADRSDTSVSETHDTAMGGMAMPGMTDTGAMGGMMSTAMMDSMGTHMRMMDTASAATLQAMLPMHRQMAGNMIARMNSEMRDMKMPADARWTALMDSVRQDLVRLPEMNAQQLKTFMSLHHGRLMRLMQRHRDMMKGTKM